MDEYKSFLRSKVRFSSLKISANGYTMKDNYDGDKGNFTGTTICVEAEEAVFTFFAFPISIPAEKSSICFNNKSLGIF